jgi:replicative DNA helicase
VSAFLDPDPLEEDLLGGLLLHPSAYFEVVERLGAEDFSHPLTRCVWQAIVTTHGRGSFSQAMCAGNARNVPDDVALPVYLATLFSNAADAEHVDLGDVADTIAERAKRQRVAHAITAAPQYLHDDNLTAEEAGAKAIASITGAFAARSNRYTADMGALMERAANRALDGSAEAESRGVGIGIPEIERLAGEWMPGHLIVLGGSSGSGKSGLAMQIAWHVAGSLPVEFHQLEMDGDSMAERHLASLTGIPMARIRRGGLNAAEQETLSDAYRAFKGRRLTLKWKARQTTGQIRSSVLASKGRNGRIGLVVVDHNKLVHVEGKVRDRIERIAVAMDDLKALAKEAECPVLILAQMTREGQKRITSGGFMIKDLRPHRYDLYGGGDMEEFADTILLAHRPEMVLPQLEPATHLDKHQDWMSMRNVWEGRGEIIAEKVRHGQAGKRVVMKWNGERTRYEPLPALDEAGW